MPSPPVQCFDPVLAGAPISHYENLAQPDLPIRPPPSTSSTPLPVPGKMLGARARAAEYHAAKNASARQASHDEEIPKLAPTPLSAYARTASANRNKGIKAFVPLVLPEDEERSSTGSGEVGEEIDRSSSPPSVKERPPRAASLPPPQSAQSGRRREFGRMLRTQTPRRRYDQQSSASIPRRVYPGDPYGLLLQAPPLGPLYVHEGYHTPALIQQTMIPATHLWWYMQPENFPGHYPFPDSFMPPTTPILDNCPAFVPQQSHGSVAKIEAPLDSPPRVVPAELPKTPELNGPRLYAFGPDDVSPTKVEEKFAARKKYFAAHPEVIARTPTTAVAERSASRAATDGGKIHFAGEELSKQAQAVNKMQIRPRQEELAHFTSFLQANTAKAKADVDSARLAQREREDDRTQHEETPLQGASEDDWPYLGQSGGFQGLLSDRLATDTRQSSRLSNGGISGGVNSARDGVEASQTEDMSNDTMRPPPGFEEMAAKHSSLEQIDSEQMTDVEFPLADVKTDTWLEIGTMTRAERDRMRRVYRTVATTFVKDNHMDPRKNGRGIGPAESKKAIRIAVERCQGRTNRVARLADEMQRRWEFGGGFQSASISKAQAAQHAGTVKSVGDIMVALSMQTDEDSHRGSKRYYTPPEYMINRGVGTGVTGRPVSMFGPDEDECRAAPLRLARDPRFRPRLPDGLAFGVEDGRVPRMFRRIIN